MNPERYNLSEPCLELNSVPKGQERVPPAAVPVRPEAAPIDMELWALNGLDIALTRIEQVQRTLVRAAELFREENKGDANRYFIHCIDGLERFFEAIAATRTALKIDFAQVAIEGIRLSTVEAEFLGILKAIVECQEKHDYIALADKVEYELITNLYSWAVLLGQLRVSLHSNA
jgi:hypothetical protein